MRELLNIVDLSNAEYSKEQGEEERAAYCASISAVFPRLEKDIKKFLYQQLIKTSMQSETWEQVLVGRGVFAGMEILLEHWQKANAEHWSKSLPQEEFSKSSPISEI